MTHTLRTPDPYRGAVSRGASYVAVHPKRDTIGKSLMWAIGRLIDKGELSWNATTDALHVTRKGRIEAGKANWWWRNERHDDDVARPGNPQSHPVG